MTDHIRVTEDAGVKVIRFNRADKKNAITQAMYSALADGIADAETGDCAAIVFFGQSGIFSAGNDIMDFMSKGMTGDLIHSPTMRFLRALATSKKPMIAGVDGAAVGVGTTMLMHCDMVFASERSTFKTPFLNLGLVPEAGSSLIAPRMMGPQRAFEMLVLGETFTAERAHGAGLVNHLVAEEALEKATMDAAFKLAALPPEALALSRGLMRGDEAEILARIDAEAVLFGERLKSREAQEAFMAFMEKRPPNFRKAVA